MSVYFKGDKVGNTIAIGNRPTQTKTATPTTSQQLIEPDSGYELSSVTVNAVTSSIDANIQSSNIKDGINILGVAGSVIEYNPTRNETVTPSTMQQIVSSSSASQLNSVTVDAVNLEVGNATPTTSQQTLLPTSPNLGFSQVTVDAVTSSIDANITAGNIKNGVSILGVTGNYQGSGGSEIIRTFDVTAPQDADILIGHVICSSGIILAYKNMIALYDVSTGTTTKLCDLNIGIPAPIFKVLDNKRCFIYGTSLTVMPASSDVVLVNLENKTARILSSINSSEVNLIKMTDDKYVLSMGVKIGNVGDLNGGSYEYSLGTDTFTALSGTLGIGGGYKLRSEFSTDTRFYFDVACYYDIQNDTFTAIDKTGFSATYPTFVQSVGTDIILIWETYSYSSGGCGYYVISENKCYNFEFGGTVKNRFIGRVEFSNHNFVLTSTTASNLGLYFFDYTTKTLSQITSTGTFFISSQNWVVFQNDVFVSMDNTGQLVEIDNAGNSYISSVNVSNNSNIIWQTLNNKLYLTRQIADFGIWEYDYTNHTATQIITSNGYLSNMFVMYGNLYLSSYTSSSTGIYKVDISNQTTTQVYNAGYNFNRALELADGYWVASGTQKVLYNSSADTYTLSVSNNSAMGNLVLDMGTNGMLITYSNTIPYYYPYYDKQLTVYASSPLFWIYNKNTHTFLTTFANLGSSAGYTYPGNALIYANNKALALGNPLVKFEVTSNSQTSSKILSSQNMSQSFSGSVISQENDYAIIRLVIGTNVQFVKFIFATETFEAQTTTITI